ncbi:hypothetical protein [Rhodanobacter geophilus]|uniref:Secreted protein n=1 Tax=Rhodanobacter geophilus TaxID=3162488 RepID=A0ABV3QNQ2_9GAMM
MMLMLILSISLRERSAARSQQGTAQHERADNLFHGNLLNWKSIGYACLGMPPSILCGPDRGVATIRQVSQTWREFEGSPTALVRSSLGFDAALT